MLFGSFDGIHPGHEYLMEQASKHGSNMVVVVAPDSVIRTVKQQDPLYKLNERMKHLSERFPNAVVVAGDEEEGEWSPIKNHRPDIIVIGYDQTELKTVLESIQSTYDFELVQVDPFHPDRYKSSIIRQQKNP